MPSAVSALALALLALSPFAAARPTGTRPDVVRPSKATPTSKPPAPLYKEDAQIMDMINAMAAAASASAVVNARRNLDSTVDVDVQRRAVGDGELFKRGNTTSSCLDSTANDTIINSLLYYGGAGTTVQLCPGATISIESAIFFTAANQVITTQGNPTDDTRATIVVAGTNQSCAIYGACDACQNIVVQNIQVDGSRPALGYVTGGPALLELGGNTVGQTVQNCHIYEPRGWSALHGIEGYNNNCRGMIIQNNQIGPSGMPPNTGSQFKRDVTTVVPPGQWADGVSIACQNSKVTGNTITDATDGPIVIFGALGTVVSGNTIISKTRVSLGGVNLVDWSPYSGSFQNVVVEDNTLIADTSMIKVGIAIGGMVWGSDNRTAARTFAGTVRNNVFQSGSTGYFGYAIAIAGHENATVYGNDASGANFGGDPSTACIPSPMVPTSQALVYDHWTTPGTVMQNNFQDHQLVFLICQEPGAIVGSGMVSASTGLMLSGVGAVNVSVSSTSTSVSSTVSSTSTSTVSSTSTSTTVSSTSTSTTVASSSAALSTSSSSSSSSPVSSTTTVPSTSSTSKSTTSAATTTPASTRKTYKDRTSSSSKTTTTTTTTTTTKAATSLTWTKVTSAAVNPKRLTLSQRVALGYEKRAIIQDGDNVPFLGKRDEAVIGYAKPTPVVNLVNPFELLEQHARLR
ncbi:hypothetical protein JCM5296_003232 [Sporobolomyces johnsonii]